MRWALSLLLLATIAASCVLPADSTSSGSGAGGDAGARCSQSAGCSACTQCALNGSCATLWATCQANSGCLAIDQCYALCGAGDASCRQQCLANSPAGASDYMAVNNCVQCQQCPTACGLCGT
jgi:hypothetical protein